MCARIVSIVGCATALLCFSLAGAHSVTKGKDKSSTAVSCRWEGKTYPRFKCGVDSDGFKTVAEVIAGSTAGPGFNSEAFKKRVTDAARNLPTGGSDYTRYLVESDSSIVVLLGEFGFQSVPEVTFLKYSIVDWRRDEDVEGIDHYEILVGFNSLQDHVYFLTHPFPDFRRGGRNVADDREYPLSVMKGNFNAMLTDSRELRQSSPLCLAALWSALEIWESGYPCFLISCSDDLLCALRFSKMLSQQQDSFDPYGADRVLEFGPGLDSLVSLDRSLPNLPSEEEERVLNLVETLGVPISPVVEWYGNAGTWRAELSLFNTYDRRLYRVEVWTNMAGEIETWKILAEPVALENSL